MKKIIIFVVSAMFISGAAMAQSQYQYSPSKLTQEQQHMLEQAKVQTQQRNNNMSLQKYRDQAKNPKKYQVKSGYNNQRKSYR